MTPPPPGHFLNFSLFPFLSLDWQWPAHLYLLLNLQLPLYMCCSSPHVSDIGPSLPSCINFIVKIVRLSPFIIWFWKIIQYALSLNDSTRFDSWRMHKHYLNNIYFCRDESIFKIILYFCCCVMCMCDLLLCWLHNRVHWNFTTSLLQFIPQGYVIFFILTFTSLDQQTNLS